jgi:hypothetical protein
MLKRLAIVLALVGVGSITLPAAAGNVRLVSDTWDNICKVEIKWGMNAPQEGPGETFNNVPRDWSVTKADRICYRRSGDPAICSSQWTPWSCCTHLISGTDDCSLS